VVVNGTQAGILQRSVAVHVVETRFDLVNDQHGVGGDFPVEGRGFLLGQVDVNAAYGIDDLDKGVEVDADIMVHRHIETVFHRLHGQLCAAVAEGVGDPVVLALVSIQQNGNAGAALDGNQLDGVLLNVEG